MTSESDPLHQALLNARRAYQAGDHQQVRYWAQQATVLAPQREDGWLWLAAVSTPQESVNYLKQALKVAPQSRRARDGMHWAVKRLRESTPLPPPRANISNTAATLPISVSVAKPEIRRPGLQFTSLQWALIVIILCLLVIAVSIQPIQTALNMPAYAQGLPKAVSALVKASDTPVPSNTPTATPSPTPFPTNTQTVVPTDTATPAPSDTPTLIPTNTPAPIAPLEPLPISLPDVGRNERWIDVDLTNQLTHAYEGDYLINSFVVSTGTWEHPTLTGQFYIYVKYESAPMAGPGYYLPGVPYIMYYYKGYGLHGTYWHNNFGVPMSHGCINLRTPDAEWLYYWASIGTMVNIHY